MNFKDRTVFISGANRGIGAALVRDVLNRGPRRVYAAARRPSSLPDFDDERIVPTRLDLTDSGLIAAAANRADDVDVLINNAGAFAFTSALSGDMADIRNDVEVNYLGTLSMMRAFLPVLQAQTNPFIVNVASIAAFVNFPFHGGYCASKAALFSITQGARIELARQGIKVLSVNPGPIDTDMGRYLDIEKTSAAETARSILDGIEAETEDIFPDPVGAEMFENWKADYKSLETVSADFLNMLEAQVVKP